MLLILSENTDVYFNLAAEEHILHHFTEDVLMLWRSKKAVVCGKHQNICAELNYGYCRKNGIQPARRLSGGGTVYHDPGNINFTFIQHLPEGLEKAINFRRFLDPMVEALQAMGVPAEYSQRNDLLLHGKKISGNAEHIYQKGKRVLHHGTLLFDSDLTDLKNALHPDGTYTDKAVKSVRSEVTNIKTVLPGVNADEFLENLYQFWISREHTNRYVFCGEDVESIEKLRSEKYATTDWIVHYSPFYNLNRNIAADTGDFELELSVQNGKIQTLQLTGVVAKKFNQDIIRSFAGKRLDEGTSLEFDALLRFLGAKSDPFVLF